MGREIRRVPPNWEHPRQRCLHNWGQGCTEARRNNGYCYKPLYDHDFETEIEAWIADYRLWQSGKHPDYVEGELYWEYYAAPPDPELCRPKFEVEPTWYQVYQTVSEGTPVTPPFATKEELINYLVEYGDFWDQHDNRGGWKYEAAKKFVENEYAPSFSATISESAIEIKEPRDGD